MNRQERWKRLQSWFHRLDSLATTARHDELARLRSEEPDLHASLIQLFDEEGLRDRELALDRLAEGATPRSGSRAAGSTHLEPHDDLPQQIGPYRILRTLGSGGMGTVYEAEQVEHVRRRVALKLIRPGLDSSRIVERFHRERQSLAVMDHPNIAKVLDAGTAPSGRPYFVMELVEGESITGWANRRRLSIEERIELFLPVCRAVQHAHTKGIIHRDLKPNNILVSEIEGIPVPKVIDFGIAKAIEQPEVVRTLATRLGEIVGTPAYMSPEQAALGRVDVDTRSDVYGLGIVLYELLVGQLPLPDSDLAELMFDEICRRVREDEAPRPSARISQLGTAPGGIAPAQIWSRRLRGDLDRVVLKALAKSRDQRYDSPSSFASDLERFLGDLPVEAVAPSLGYRAAKLYRRHRAAVLTAVLASVLVLAGLVLATVSWLDARRSEREARAALVTAGRTTEFLTDLFRDVAPGDQPGVQVTARQLLDRGAEQLERGLEREPEVRAALLHTLGLVYGNLPDYTRSEHYLRQSLELRKTLPDPDPLEIARTRVALGEILGIREEFDEGQDLLTTAYETLVRELGAHSTDTLQAREDLGSLLASRGDLDPAVEHIEAVVAARRELGEPLYLAESLRVLGIIHQKRHERDRALEVLGESLDLYRSQGAEGSLAATDAQISLATVLVHRGEMDRAVPLFRAAAETRRRLAGETSHSYSWSISMLAWALRQDGQLEEAEKWMRQGLELQRRILGNDNSEVAQILGNLGRIIEQRSGDPEEVEALYEESLAIAERTMGPNHPTTIEGIVRLARWRSTQNRLAEAETLAREVLRRLDEAGVQGSGRWYREALLGDVLTAQGRFDEAEALLRPAWENLRRVEGDEARSTNSAARMLSELYRTTGRIEDAQKLEEGN